jgi:lysophospholipase L1-like esterase
MMATMARRQARGIAFITCLMWAVSAVAQTKPATDFRFVAGETKIADYDASVGFGFESGAKIVVHDGFITSDKPFYFSVKLPEGNYDVAIILGDKVGESTTTVKAELRRLMLENVHTAAGDIVTKHITVNIRRAEISGGDHVHLKPRESASEAWAWDDKLTLEFSGARPRVREIAIKATNVPTVYLLGDSTVADQPMEPWNSWGQMLTRFLKPWVAVSNQSESGETADGSIRAGRLAKVLSTIRAGDYLFVQFGHNDMKEKGTGVGAFTTYTAALKQYVDGARAKGAIPVLVTSVNRKQMDSDGHVVNTLKDYPDAVRKLAKDENVALIDLNAMSKTLYEAIGAKNLSKIFVDGTHHNTYGSYELAKCIVQGIIDDKLGLSAFVVDDWQTFDPAKPDPIDSIKIPASPKWDKAAPAGS